MQYGTVTGRFLSPDGAPLSGSVRFVPEVSAVLVSGVDPATVLPADVVATLDAEGRLTHGGTLGVDLLIPEAGVTNPVSWTWRVYPKLRHGDAHLTVRSWSIDVPAAGVDITEAAPVPSTTGEGITRGLSAYEVWLANGHTGTVDDYLASLAAGGVDLSAYVTDDELAGYATTAYVDSAVANADVDLTGYATTAYADQAEVGAVTTANTYTDQQISAIPALDLTGYVTDTELTTALGSKANTTDVVLTVGGVAPDENGDVPAPSGGGGDAIQDTGWRSLPVPVGWAASGGVSRIHLRRVGGAVQVEAYVLYPDTGGTKDLVEMPPGFRFGAIGARGSVVGAFLTLQAPPIVTPVFSSGGTLRMYGLQASNSYYGLLTYHTDDPFPTVLPGSPA